MKKILLKLKSKFKKLNSWNPPVSSSINIIKIGTEYGGWTIPSNFLSENSICYLVGAGEDISFDVGLVEKYGCEVFIYDPTPRAKLHFEQLVKNTSENKKTPINNSKNDFYNLSPGNIHLLKFKDLGVWNCEKELKFYSPKNPEHVSHSALNLQKTDSYFIAKVDRLSKIMDCNGHKYLDLLKIDIEGAEYVVIDSIIEDQLKIKVLNVEFDEANNALDENSKSRINDSIKKLISYGYKVIDNSMPNMTFILDSTYSELTLRK